MSMGKIIRMGDYRIAAAEERGFVPWQHRFNESYDRASRLADLSDSTLLFLARPGEESAVAFYELIMGILDLGTATKFSYMEQKEQMKVVDIHLFLADQIRFEVMRRLGWVERFPGGEFTLLEIVMGFETVRDACRERPPRLALSHPDYATYEGLTNRDRESFIRRLLSAALESFSPE
jgi:hypothetical protein